MKTKNIFYFLEYIVKHRKYCTNVIAKDFMLSTKTIQRYKKELEEYLGVAFVQYKRGCYEVPYSSKLKKFLIDPKEKDEFYYMLDVLQIANSKFLHLLDLEEKTLEKLVQETPYFLKESPFEELKNFQLLHEVKKAISYRHCVDVEYFSDKKYSYVDVKPLKIVFVEGNWYLAAMTDDTLNNGFKFLRINFIEKISLQPKTFHQEYRALDFLQNFQTLFSSYLAQPYEVQVKVSKDIARFFEVKKFLSSQKIVQKQPNGDLVLSYTITNKQEIILLAKKWLPDFKILSPKSLSQEYETLIKKYLTT